MLVTWRYRERKGSFAQCFDPRAWFVFFVCFLFSSLMYWDFRYLLPFFIVTLLVIITSRVSWRESKRAWLFVGFFVLFYASLTFLTGRGSIEAYAQEHDFALLQAPFTIFGWQPTFPISVERIFFAISQFLRLFSIAGMTVLIPYTINPAQH
jgi:energy-coupling factor transport system permease protein